MEIAILSVGERRRRKRLAAIREHASKVISIDVPSEHLVWLSEAARKHDLPSEALHVVYLIERYCRRPAWRLVEWVVVWLAWFFGLSHHFSFFDLTVGLCQVRVSSWLTAKGRPARDPGWQDLQELMSHRDNIFACASVLARELGRGRSAARSVLADDLREKHFSYPPTIPGDCVGLGDVLEELIHLQRGGDTPELFGGF